MPARKFDPDNMHDWTSIFWNRAQYDNVLAGVNDDDCAVLKVKQENIIISVDYLNANPIAIELGVGTFRDLGKLVVAANLSDLCGTGATPIGFLVSIMLKKQTASKKNFVNFMSGVKEELLKHKIPLVGGDTKLGNADVFCGVAIGKREKGTRLFLKNAAVAGDKIWVSGNIGSVAASIDFLRSKRQNRLLKKWSQERITNPDLPLEKSRKLSKIKGINAGTDLSDGLGADLFSLCKASKVGAIIDVDKIPISKEVKLIADSNGVESWNYAFTIGGDFQFIVTARKGVELSKFGMTYIGDIQSNKTLYIRKEGVLRPFPKMGHRDVNIKSFGNEVASLLKNINNKK